MEKTTKKKKAKKGLKKRIGLIAVGGLSLVLTICLSVGATLAWFAGSTHADNSLYMGGPVYVEMTGKDSSGNSWQGGSGQLDINAFQRGMGTADGETGVLLPGQGFAIYSQARVFSTSKSDSRKDSEVANTSSGANTTNTSVAGSTGMYATDTGRVTTTTSAVLRARFSVNVEFDPSVGYNNFSDTDYASNYPVQSTNYQGAYRDDKGKKVTTTTDEGSLITPRTALTWESALGTKSYEKDAVDTLADNANSRRDGVNTNTTSTTFTSVYKVGSTSETEDKNHLIAIRNGSEKSIYSWKYVTKTVYENGTLTATIDAYENSIKADSPTALGETVKYVKMPAPFDGNKVTDSEKEYSASYGVWVLDDNKKLKESDSFYNARCNAYIQTYVESYLTEYDPNGQPVERKIGQGLKALENALNNSFIDLINDSSNAMIAGYLNGYTVGSDGLLTWNTKTTLSDSDKRCSWLYVDPSIGNDTNTGELSTSTGGWWYLVECNNGKVGRTNETDSNKISVTKDNYDTLITDGDPTTGQVKADDLGNIKRTNNIKTTGDATLTEDEKNNAYAGFTRNTENYNSTNDKRLDAKLYEIKNYSKLTGNGSGVTTNGTGSDKDVVKTVSYQFPFVNGRAALDGDKITNIFANAKITVQISFQAVQAFFPFTTSIDGIGYKDTLLGTAKALSIRNAIPIYNEAFDYYEDTSAGTISGL